MPYADRGRGLSLYLGKQLVVNIHFRADVFQIRILADEVLRYQHAVIVPREMPQLKSVDQ